MTEGDIECGTAEPRGFSTFQALIQLPECDQLDELQLAQQQRLAGRNGGASARASMAKRIQLGHPADIVGRPKPGGSPSCYVVVAADMNPIPSRHHAELVRARLLAELAKERYASITSGLEKGGRSGSALGAPKGRPNMAAKKIQIPRLREKNDQNMMISSSDLAEINIEGAVMYKRRFASGFERLGKIEQELQGKP